MRIEDYGLIGDTQTAALVGRNGSIDWCSFPRFDSGACFAALLGGRDNGCWRIAPTAPARAIRRRYRDGTLILETETDTEDGTIRLIDFMPVRGEEPDIVRIVEGVRGAVQVTVELIIRFDYGHLVPWVRRTDDVLTAVAGPDAICVRGDVDLRGRELTTLGQFVIRPGERRALALSWYPSHGPLPRPIDVQAALAETERRWSQWSGRCRYTGPWSEAVQRSLMVLKALTYGPTGGIVAAPTTSLPEWPGSARNWDYRFCWVRDATLTLFALLLAGYTEEAEAWREWLLRAAAGDPSRLQIMYGLGGEHRLPELDLPWLPGYEDSRPVRVGNQAHQQLQLDVYGELVETLYEARRFGISPNRWAWDFERHLLDKLESRWREPDEGIWEIRGPRRHFTHSKVMAWVAFDRAAKTVEKFGLQGPVERWRAVRDEIHAEVCSRGFDGSRNTFVQAYGRPELDANLLMIPLVGFLPANHPRVAGTVRAIERELMRDGLLLRYRTDSEHTVDRLPPGEGVFLPCSFWLADAYVEMGRHRDGVRLFERLLSLRNDLGLLSEEYDPASGRMLGNFPQAFTHLALVNTAYNLAGTPDHPSRCRSEEPCLTPHMHDAPVPLMP